MTPAPPRADHSSPLKRLAALLADDMARVDAIIAERMQSPVGTIPDLASHLISAGGKRLRPMLTVAAARLNGYTGEDHAKLAATVEFIHTATLLHDDVVDGSDLRRGKAAANLVWGNSASVLVGDFLFARSFNLMVETGSLKVLEILSAASSVIAEGEVRQLTALNDTATSVDDYMAIIDAKTAALFAAAAQVGAVIAQASETVEEQLRRYGRELGLAFQLVDDALDYRGMASRLGKAVGDDFREGKVTLPVALAVQRAEGDERTFWARAMGDVDQRPDDFETALDILEKRGALADTLAAARGHAEAAKTALDGLASDPIVDALRDLCDFVVERAY